MNWMQKISINIPSKLYHATYGEYLESIKRKGLIPRYHCTWRDCQWGIYLADDPYEAESYAEVAPDDNSNIPEEYIDDIVILEIDSARLDQSKLDIDPHVQWNENPLNISTFIYKDSIPFSSISILNG